MTVYTGPSTPQGGVIAQGEAQAFTPEIWIPAVIRYRQRAFNMMQFVDMMTFDGKKGDTVRKPYIGRLRSRKKLPGQPVQFETKKEGEWKMVVDRYSYAGFAIDHKLDYTTEIDLARAYTPEIAQALVEDIELSLLAERATFIAYDSTNNHITSSDPITYANFLAAYETLLLRQVKPEDMVYIIGPRQLVTMFTITEFIQNGTYNSGNIANIPSGTIVGTLLGVPVVMNTNIRENSTTDFVLGGDDYEDTTNGEVIATPGMADSPYLPTQYGSDQHSITLSNGYLTAGYTSGMLLSKKAIAMAMVKRPSLEIWWNPDYQETRLISTQIFDIKVIDPKLAVVISTDETAAVA